MTVFGLPSSFAFFFILFTIIILGIIFALVFIIGFVIMVVVAIMIAVVVVIMFALEAMLAVVSIVAVGAAMAVPDYPSEHCDVFASGCSGFFCNLETTQQICKRELYSLGFVLQLFRDFTFSQEGFGDRQEPLVTSIQFGEH